MIGFRINTLLACPVMSGDGKPRFHVSLVLKALQLPAAAVINWGSCYLQIVAHVLDNGC
jgi:hypothetical protein